MIDLKLLEKMLEPSYGRGRKCSMYVDNVLDWITECRKDKFLIEELRKENLYLREKIKFTEMQICQNSSDG